VGLMVGKVVGLFVGLMVGKVVGLFVDWMVGKLVGEVVDPQKAEPMSHHPHWLQHKLGSEHFPFPLSPLPHVPGADVRVGLLVG